jgi:hypothetical protein
MRIAQINSEVVGSFNNSRNKPGAISKNIAEGQKLLIQPVKYFLHHADTYQAG